MAFKYLIISFEGGLPTGTDDLQVAKEFAAQDEYVVVDASQQWVAPGYELEAPGAWVAIKEQQDYKFD